MNIHRQIRKMFRVAVRNDFSPIGCHRGDRITLVKLWGMAGYRLGAEIGVHRAAYSTAILSEIPDVHLHCIDPWEVYAESRFTKNAQDRHYAVAMDRLKPYIKEGRATVHKDYSENVYPKFKDGELDFLFIDGLHTFDACALDLIHWSPKVRKGGMVAVHDYNAMRRGGVIEAVNSYTRCHMIEPWFVTREENPTVFWVV